MDKLEGISKKIHDNLARMVNEKINENYTSDFHQKNVFEGGIYGGARSVTDVSTGDEEASMRVGIRSGMVGR